METEVDEGIEVRARDEVHGPAASAVAAVRSAARDELLAAKAETAVAPASGCDANLDFVYKQALRTG
jgi:hypothetical protein